MTTRNGFTLLEVMVAVVVSSLVALLSYATARVGFDTNDRIDEHVNATVAELTMRTFLTDALRHPAEGGGIAMNDTLLVFAEDRLAFASRAALVTLTASDSGLHLHAEPRGRDLRVTDVVVPDVSGFRVSVLDRTGDPAWQSQWRAAGRMPAAVMINFVSTRRVLAPLVAHTALEIVR